MVFERMKHTLDKNEKYFLKVLEIALVGKILNKPQTYINIAKIYHTAHEMLTCEERFDKNLKNQ